MSYVCSALGQHVQHHCGIVCRSGVPRSRASRSSTAKVFSTTISLGSLNVRARAPKMGPVICANKGKNVFVGVPHTINEGVALQPIWKIPMYAFSRL